MDDNGKELSHELERIDDDLESKENVHQSLKSREVKVKRSSVLVPKNESSDILINNVKNVNEERCSRRSEEMDRLNHLFETLSIRSISEGREIEEFTSDLIENEFELIDNEAKIQKINDTFEDDVFENHGKAGTSEEVINKESLDIKLKEIETNLKEIDEKKAGIIKIIVTTEEGINYGEEIKNLDETLVINNEGDESQVLGMMNISENNSKKNQCEEEVNTKRIEENLLNNSKKARSLNQSMKDEAEIMDEEVIVDEELSQCQERVINIKEVEENVADFEEKREIAANFIKSLNKSNKIEVDAKNLDEEVFQCQEKATNLKEIEENIRNYEENGEIAANLMKTLNKSNKIMGLNQTIEVDAENIDEEISQCQEKTTNLKGVEEIAADLINSNKAMNLDQTLKVGAKNVDKEMSQCQEISTNTKEIEENVVDFKENGEIAANLMKNLNKIMGLNQTIEVDAENIDEEISQCQERAINLKGVEEIAAGLIKSNKAMNLDQTLDVDAKNMDKEISQCQEKIIITKELEENVKDFEESDEIVANLMKTLNKSNKIMGLYQTIEVDAKNIDEEISQCQERAINLKGVEEIAADLVKSNKVMNLDQTLDVDAKNMDKEISQFQEKAINTKEVEENIVDFEENREIAAYLMKTLNKSNNSVGLNQTIEVDAENIDEEISQCQEKATNSKDVEEIAADLIKSKKAMKLDQTLEVDAENIDKEISQCKEKAINTKQVEENIVNFEENVANLMKTHNKSNKMVGLNQTIEVDAENIKERAVDSKEVKENIANFEEKGKFAADLIKSNRTIYLNESLDIDAQNMDKEEYQCQERAINTKGIEENVVDLMKSKKKMNLDQTLEVDAKNIDKEISQCQEKTINTKQVEENIDNFEENDEIAPNLMKTLNKSNKTVGLNQTIEVDEENIKERAVNSKEVEENVVDFEEEGEMAADLIKPNKAMNQTLEVDVKNMDKKVPQCQEKITNLKGVEENIVNFEEKDKIAADLIKSNKEMNLNQTLEVDVKNMDKKISQCQEKATKTKVVEENVVDFEEKGEIGANLITSRNKAMKLNQTMEVDAENVDEEVSRCQQRVVNSKRVEENVVDFEENDKIAMDLITSGKTINLNQTMEVDMHEEESHSQEKATNPKRIEENAVYINNFEDKGIIAAELIKTHNKSNKTMRLNETMEVDVEMMDEEVSQCQGRATNSKGNEGNVLDINDFEEKGENASDLIQTHYKAIRMNETMEVDMEIIDEEVSQYQERATISKGNEENGLGINNFEEKDDFIDCHENIQDKLSQNQEIVNKTQEVYYPEEECNEKINNLDATLVINEENLNQSPKIVTTPNKTAIKSAEIREIKNCADEGNLNKPNKTINLNETIEIHDNSMKEEPSQRKKLNETLIINNEEKLSQLKEIKDPATKSQRKTKNLNETIGINEYVEEISSHSQQALINPEKIETSRNLIKSRQPISRKNLIKTLNQTIDINTQNKLQKDELDSRQTKLNETLIVNPTESINSQKLNETFNAKNDQNDQKEFKAKLPKKVKRSATIVIKSRNGDVDSSKQSGDSDNVNKEELNETFNAENHQKGVGEEFKAKLPNKVKGNATIVIKPENGDGSSKHFGDSDRVGKEELNETLVIKSDKGEMNETFYFSPIKETKKVDSEVEDNDPHLKKKKLFKTKKIEMVDSSTQCNNVKDVQPQEGNKYNLKLLQDYDQNILRQISEVSTLKEEHSSRQEFLTNLESAFSTAHEKYERCKSAACVYKDNEEMLKKCLAEADEKVTGCMKNERNFKSKIEKCLNEYYGQLILKRDEHAREMRKLAKTVKIMEIKVKSMETNLAQKCEERDNLMSVLNDSVRH